MPLTLSASGASRAAPSARQTPRGGRTAARDTVRAAFASAGNRADLLACKGVAPGGLGRQWANGVNLLAYVAKTDTVGDGGRGPQRPHRHGLRDRPVIPQARDATGRGRPLRRRGPRRLVRLPEPGTSPGGPAM